MTDTKVVTKSIPFIRLLASAVCVVVCTAITGCQSGKLKMPQFSPPKLAFWKKDDPVLSSRHDNIAPPSAQLTPYRNAQASEDSGRSDLPPSRPPYVVEQESVPGSGSGSRPGSVGIAANATDSPAPLQPVTSPSGSSDASNQAFGGSLQPRPGSGSATMNSATASPSDGRRTTSSENSPENSFENASQFALGQRSGGNGSFAGGRPGPNSVNSGQAVHGANGGGLSVSPPPGMTLQPKTSELAGASPGPSRSDPGPVGGGEFSMDRVADSGSRPTTNRFANSASSQTLPTPKPSGSVPHMAQNGSVGSADSGIQHRGDAIGTAGDGGMSSQSAAFDYPQTPYQGFQSAEPDQAAYTDGTLDRSASVKNPYLDPLNLPDSGGASGIAGSATFAPGSIRTADLDLLAPTGPAPSSQASGPVAGKSGTAAISPPVSSAKNSSPNASGSGSSSGPPTNSGGEFRFR